MKIYVERKQGFAVEAKNMLTDLQENLGMHSLTGIRIIIQYQIDGITDEALFQAKKTIFSEPMLDDVYDAEPEHSGRKFQVEFLPGQYDQQADFAAQCVQIITLTQRPQIKVSRLYLLDGNINDEDFSAIKAYCINPIEARELVEDETSDFTVQDIEVIQGFIDADIAKLEEIRNNLGLAMDVDDIAFCCEYFSKTEKRNPTLTEIKVLDTFWSDHCRHTTFLTHLENVEIKDKTIANVYKDYLKYRNAAKPISLMDIALAAMKRLKAEGKLANLDESEEINACSIEVMADIDGEQVPYLVMFKNETHNHPTEIEPFGGAATCLGGAIRDPLSGRSYVYQAMRVTGSGDPRESVADTIPGKLPQRKLTKTAAKGFSSYGNQIGLATGMVSEIYHEGYKAKRMEIGAVVGAAPKENVVREIPEQGDLIILLGGRTGRDGCGGATGSSKAHDDKSLANCGSEVQKGNPPEERKLMRLFRNPQVSKMIKRCNDFGAGGVCVAVGELADSLQINLDKVTKKYEGLNGTELAISESQERMAVVVKKEDAESFIELAHTENLEANVVAEVTDSGRLVMTWRGETIVDISREFLNTNGASKKASAVITKQGVDEFFKPVQETDLQQAWINSLSKLSQCSQKGLVEMFDSTVGGNTVLMPFGGKTQYTPIQAMAAKLPVESGETDTATIMAYGFNPNLSSLSPFYGAIYAHVEAIAKLVSHGADYTKAYFTLQEYFERLGKDPKRWGKPLSALLGAYHAQISLGLGAIGGKDSMSGSFMDMDVPPTLVAFAIAPGSASGLISPDLKEPGHKLVLLKPRLNNFMPDFADLTKQYKAVYELVKNKKIYSGFTLTSEGICETAKMCFGNNIGIKFEPNVELFTPYYAGIVLEVDKDTEIGQTIGYTTEESCVSHKDTEIQLSTLLKAYTGTLENVFPSEYKAVSEILPTYETRNNLSRAILTRKPKVFLPVFPGTNCEYETKRAFEKAGAEVETFSMKNLSPKDIEDSLEVFASRINESEIFMLAGGFSAGDEPDGSGKFIATVLRNPRVSEAINKLIKRGLVLGICNGFQALIKLGLLPYGEIRSLDSHCPTLTYNTVSRHVSTYVTTRIVSVKSPWFKYVNPGDEHVIPLSHGEGRIIISKEEMQKLTENGQIATQYIDVNPNGSMFEIEGLTSPDGRILGKMGHSERIGNNVCKNIYGNKDQELFKAGVDFFKA